jgi:hypothetical protein
MVRLRTIQLTAGLLGLLVTVGCQHQHHREGCPCSCASEAQPAGVTEVKPVMKPVPAEPAVRTTVGNPL